MRKGCGIRTSNRNSHEEQAILLKSVVAPTRYHGLGAGREAPEVDLIIPTHPYLRDSNPFDEDFYPQDSRSRLPDPSPGWRMILLPIRPNWPACPKKGRLWSGSWGHNHNSLSAPRPKLCYRYGLNLRSTPERTSPGPRSRSGSR